METNSLIDARKLRDLQVKKPWKVIQPNGYKRHGNVARLQNLVSVNDSPLYATYTQADMEREYFPSGHRINDRVYFPDIFMKEVDPETGKVTYYKNEVPRKSYAFQQIITTKRAMHLCGNDVNFEHVDAHDDTHTEAYNSFRQGWAQHDMDVMFSLAIVHSLIVAESAIIFFMEGGNAKTRVVSYHDGDKLYAHFGRDGKTLEVFCRNYSQYDIEGVEMVEYMEIYDRTNYYLFRRSGNEYKSPYEKIVGSFLSFFNLDDWELAEKPIPHGFGRVPVAYFRREDGACWSFSQSTIEDYELAMSQMMQNNQEYGEPAVVICTEDEAITTSRNQRGTIREYVIGKDDKVSMLQGQSAADGYQKQAEMDRHLIYRQSFCVEDIEMKSGDLPAAALKIMYSLAYEKASEEAILYHQFLRDVVELFAIAYGIESENTIAFKEMIKHIRFWIEPYVHQNNSAVMADLVSGVQNKIISRKTACDRLNGLYTSPDEFDVIEREQHQADSQDVLNQVRIMKEEARIQQNNQHPQPQQQNTQE